MKPLIRIPMALKRGGRLGLVITVGLVSGCYTNTIMTKRAGDGMLREKELSFFVGGAIGHERIDLDAVCPQGVAQIRDLTTFGDGFLAFITLGIYTPRTAEIECARETVPAATAPAEDPAAAQVAVAQSDEVQNEY